MDNDEILSKTDIKQGKSHCRNDKIEDTVGLGSQHVSSIAKIREWLPYQKADNLYIMIKWSELKI